jgi:hypothetical protein
MIGGQRRPVSFIAFQYQKKKLIDWEQEDQHEQLPGVSRRDLRLRIGGLFISLCLDF